MTQRCSRCILPDTYPDIVFDDQGVCHKCHEQERKYLRRDLAQLGRELKEIVDWAKTQNKPYDCVVPFSGGKDSSYTLHLCRRKFGMKVLAVNFNNGLRTLEALKNIETIVHKADCAYLCYGPNWEMMRGLYRQFFLATGQFCFPCDMGIWATVHRVAEHYDVPLIVSGFSAQIESRGAKIYSYNNHLFRTIARNVIPEREMSGFLGATTRQKVLRRLKHFRLTRYRRQISLPDYMVWDDVEIKRTITEELGWEKGSSKSGDHVDCLFAPIKNHLVVQKWGFGEKTTKYSAMTRAGEITREEALRRAEVEERADNSGSLAVFMEMLALTPEDIAAAKTKSHLPFLDARRG